ncbi:TIGR04222 domain-containing membrane protein [Streptomyces sp. H27-C3]|uniref:TIGR04222 domain-containing membrane protein n=1 Tax=Streptomyces sp. H27-C3 TaxID=3046305 RepID=UPI0024BA328E|nr:TIGR04222 domain-containing membrane protein [Streptomyces sp. H27-C3]MDJ0464208.1 TIGR04222 domain-containing membrane protein [Streptomyces sp. H27-C3]
MFWVLFLAVACAAVVTACARLCLAATAAADFGSAAEATATQRALALPEAAFLTGGPARVADLTLLSMHRHRRLLLAHTGWATVVDPVGRDDLERSVIRAIGSGGQARTAAVRTATAAAGAVRGVADRLVAAGLAVPDATRTSLNTAVRTVRGATLLVLALGAVSLLMPDQEQSVRLHIVAWFALPLVLSPGCLVVARMEVGSYTRWASPTGLRLLGALAPRPVGGHDGADAEFLTAVALHGAHAVADPALRAALTSTGSGHETSV